MFPGGVGRGSYGHHRGRGRGGRAFVHSSRGRGRGAVSKKWVRPTQETAQESSEEMKETSKVAASMGGDNKDDGKQSIVAAKVPVPKTSAILKGPKQHPQGPTKSHSWKRPRDGPQSESCAIETAVDDSKIETDASLEDKEKKDTTLSKSVTQPASMVRRGTHQLVSHNPIDELSNDVSTEVQQKSKEYVVSATTVAKSKEESSTSTKPMPMQKRGRNKLILVNSTEGESFKCTALKPSEQGVASMPQAESMDANEEAGSNKHAALARKGHNKLVNEAHAKRENQNIRHFQSSWGRGGGIGGSIASGRGSKRIKLNRSEQDGTLVEGDDEAGTDAEAEETSRPVAVEKYTEFAYRQSSTMTQRGRGRGSRGRGRGRNMGLVRVEPDAATTRICPAYLRGEQCTNPKCRKRHDVPKEAAIPICSFFQRNGLCNKGEACQFRHIKVNPHATVCPSFSLLGFCENKDCIMKHVRAPKKK